MVKDVRKKNEGLKYFFGTIRQSRQLVGLCGYFKCFKRAKKFLKKYFITQRIDIYRKRAGIILSVST